MIFNIQRFSTHDGNGVRTVVFYKGCPLHCWWCSNPESQSFGYSVLYDEKFCKNFGDCIVSEKTAISKENNRIIINRDSIKHPELLKNICLSKALVISGENRTVNEILNEIKKDELFFCNDGGVTLSGGEPLSQGDDLMILLQELNGRNIGVNIETTLHVNWEKVQRCIGMVDTFFVDLKHINPYKFKKFTGGEISLVMKNLVKLDSSGTNYIIRIPVIPGFNHSEKEMTEMIDFISTLKNAREINFLPYHIFGKEKYKMLGIPYLMENANKVNDEELSSYIQYAQMKGIKTKIGG